MLLPYDEPEFIVETPLGMTCQYQFTPCGGLFIQLMVTISHCGEFEIGAGGALGLPWTITESGVVTLQQPCVFNAAKY